MPPKVSMLDAVKIQARALIPIVHALEPVLGKERAHALVREAIAQDYAKRVGARSSARDTHPRAEGDNPFPVESRVVEDTEGRYAVDMTRCQFAEYFRSIGEPEIGALLTCGVDFAAQATLRPSWEFRRTQTQMEGAPFCDFRWRLRRP
jgi:hypothetical protein